MERVVNMVTRQLYYVLKALRTQWKKREELREFQEKSLKKLITYAYENTELYHRKFREANVNPSDFNTLEDMKKFPLITKADLRESYPDGVVSKKYDTAQCYKASTSGSTGQVLSIIYSPEAYEYYMAVSYRNFAALGFKPWHRFAYTRYEPIKGGAPFYEKLGIVQKMFISVFEEPEGQLAMLKEFNPHAITAYPSMLIEWAKLLKDQGNSIHPLFIRAEAEIITAEAKAFIKDVFGCDLYEEYGSSEFVHLAFECRQRGYHMASDNVFMEFLEDGEPVSPGEEGEIYATSLVNYAMPFIRYKMDDRGIPLDDTCSCGRGFPLMKLVVGRDDDYLYLPSGARVNPRTVIPFFELAPGVKEFRIVQEKKESITVDIVPGPAFTEEEKDRLRNSLLKVIKEPLEITFNLCDEIPRGRHNRPRPIRSTVNT